MKFFRDIIVTLGTIGLIFYLLIAVPHGEFNTRYWTQDMRGFWMGATGILGIIGVIVVIAKYTENGNK